MTWLMYLNANAGYLQEQSFDLYRRAKVIIGLSIAAFEISMARRLASHATH
jgi:hypothetical protein